MIEADVAIVGGGIAGTSVAAELATRCRVVLLEGEDALGWHTTGRSAAQWQLSHGDGPVRVLTSASRPLLEAIGNELDVPVLRPRPTVWIAHAGDRAAMDTVNGLAGTEVAESLAVDEAVRLCPVLRAERVAAAAIEPDAQDVDALLQFYRRVTWTALSRRSASEPY